MEKDLDGKKHNDIVAEMFNDLKPFNITVTNGFDAAYLSSALLLWLSQGQRDLADKSLNLMIDGSRKFGVSKTVSVFFEEGEKCGHRFPKFMKPLFIHMIEHMLKESE